MDDTEKKITKAKIKLFFEHPFFGNLTMGMKLLDSTDSGWCPTAATDGRNIYYNRNFFQNLNPNEVIFVLCHEILHVAFDHLGRRNHRDPGYWNMANDYVINAMLMKEKIGTMPTKPVEDPAAKARGETHQRVGLYDARYDGWYSEKIYEDLQKRKVEKKLTLDVHLELGDDAKDQPDKSGPGVKISAKGGKKLTLDVPIFGNDANGEVELGDGQGQGKDQPGTSGPGVEITAEDLRKIREEMRGRVITAAQSAQAAGKLPASIARLVNELTEPVINWRELLAQNIQSCLTDDFTFQRPNRRHMYSGVFLPSLKKDETVDVTVAIDMSGSISDKMAQEFLSEVWGITNSYADFRISVLCFDTQVYNFQVFTPDTVDDLLSYECKGGGGTDFMAFWNYWRENDIEPKKAVIFTDGYPGGEWGPSNYADTLWIITEGRHTKIVPPFGEYAYFEAQQGVVEVGTV